MAGAQTGVIERLPKAADRRRGGARSPTFPAATVALLVGGLAGCGSSTTYLSTPTVERAIAQSFLAQRHLYTRVLGPSPIPQLQGHSFQCSALFDVGSYSIPVTETDSKGHVRWSTRVPIAILDIKR